MLSLPPSPSLVSQQVTAEGTARKRAAGRPGFVPSGRLSDVTQLRSVTDRHTPSDVNPTSKPHFLILWSCGGIPQGFAKFVGLIVYLRVPLHACVLGTCMLGDPVGYSYRLNGQPVYWIMPQKTQEHKHTLTQTHTFVHDHRYHHFPQEEFLCFQ